MAFRRIVIPQLMAVKLRFSCVLMQQLSFYLPLLIFITSSSFFKCWNFGNRHNTFCEKWNVNWKKRTRKPEKKWENWLIDRTALSIEYWTWYDHDTCKESAAIAEKIITRKRSLKCIHHHHSCVCVCVVISVRC